MGPRSVIAATRSLALPSTARRTMSGGPAGVRHDLFRGHPNPASLPEDEMRTILSSLAGEGGGLRDSLNCEYLRLYVSASPSILTTHNRNDLDCANAGDARFRSAIRAFVDGRTAGDDDGATPPGRRGGRYTEDNIFVTNGVSHGLQLLCGLARPGDEVWLERPTYFLAANIFRDNGLAVRPLPTRRDAGGLDVERLTAMVEEEGVPPPRLIYVIPSYQNPTGSVLSVEERRGLAEFASRHGVTVLADEVYHLLDWERDGVVGSTAATGRPASLVRFNPAVDGDGDGDSGCCVSVSSFTKIWSPGVRVGWIEAPAPYNTQARAEWLHRRVFVRHSCHRCKESPMRLTSSFAKTSPQQRFPGRVRPLHGEGDDRGHRDRVAGQPPRPN